MHSKNSPLAIIKKTLMSFIWIIPFISFLAGYQLIAYFYSADTLTTPAVVGQSLQEALQVLSDNNLNPRIISQQEEPDLPTGTIISQTPEAGAKIKPHQSLFLVISTKPAALKSPALLGKSSTVITDESRLIGLRTKTYTLESIYPKDTCFGQSPTANKAIIDHTMIAYISAGNQKPVLLPNFKGKPLSHIQEILKNNTIPWICTDAQPIQPHHHCTTACTVVDQRPLAGSLIMLDKPLQVQLHVKHAEPQHLA